MSKLFAVILCLCLASEILAKKAEYRGPPDDVEIAPLPIASKTCTKSIPPFCKPIGNVRPLGCSEVACPDGTDCRINRRYNWIDCMRCKPFPVAECVRKPEVPPEQIQDPCDNVRCPGTRKCVRLARKCVTTPCPTFSCQPYRFA